MFERTPVVERGSTTPLERAGMHPAKTFALTILLGYTLMFLALVGAGSLLEYVVGHGWADGDAALSEWFAENRTTGFDDITEIGSKLADTIGIVGFAAVACVVFAGFRRFREALTLVSALALEILLFLAVNTLIDRPRPDVERLGSTPSTGSFPSGHVAATVALYATLTLLFSRWVPRSRRAPLAVVLWSVTAFLALLVAFSRVYRGMHYSSDVLFGLVMGAACVAVAFRAVRAPGHDH